MGNGLRAARIAAVFGLLFIEFNAGHLHPTALDVAVRVVGAIVFVVIFVQLVRRRGAAGGPPAEIVETFGLRYWAAVLVEIAVLAVGLLVITGHIHVGWSLVHDLRRHEKLAEAGWTAFAVGLHFFGLLLVWHRPTLGLVGVLITVCGIVALAFAANGAQTSSALFAGILPGALLLLTSATRLRSDQRRTQRSPL